MAVVNNTYPAQTTDNSGMGFFLGMLMFFVLLILLIYYALPILRSGAGFVQPQIQVPSKVDINVNQGDTKQKK